MGKPEGKRPTWKTQTQMGIILKRSFSKWDAVMDWIFLAQDRDR